MGKTRDLFKKIRHTKGKFHAKMGSIKDRNGIDLTPKKDAIFIIGDWDAKGGSQEIPGVIGKFGLEVQNEAGQRLRQFCKRMHWS